MAERQRDSKGRVRRGDKDGNGEKLASVWLQDERALFANVIINRRVFRVFGASCASLAQTAGESLQAGHPDRKFKKKQHPAKRQLSEST